MVLYAKCIHARFSSPSLQPRTRGKTRPNERGKSIWWHFHNGKLRCSQINVSSCALDGKFSPNTAANFLNILGSSPIAPSSYSAHPPPPIPHSPSQPICIICHEPRSYHLLIVNGFWHIKFPTFAIAILKCLLAITKRTFGAFPRLISASQCHSHLTKCFNNDCEGSTLREKRAALSPAAQCTVHPENECRRATGKLTFNANQREFTHRWIPSYCSICYLYVMTL